MVSVPKEQPRRKGDNDNTKGGGDLRSKVLMQVRRGAQDPHTGACFLNEGRGTFCILVEEKAVSVGADIGGLVNQGQGR